MPASEYNPTADVFAIAADLGLISAESLDALRRDCRSSGQSPTQFLSARGLLTAVDVDIVETLVSEVDVIPGYRVLGLIGKGGMGVVYRAEQRNLGRTVALKTILVSRMADKSMLDRFQLEARTIGQLRHPNIIAAHDFGRHGGRVFLAMELVDGTDLDRRIKDEGPVDEFTAWGLIRQTVAGLAHAREHRVVHRDIKPANLMLVDPPAGYPLPVGMPMVKIADFGLALLQEDLGPDTRLTAPDATVGSPHYMAPEQLETSDVDQRADMYALGATAFHALAGKPPFSGMKLSQLIAAKLGEGAPRIETAKAGLTPAGCELVARLLARMPEDRPSDYYELLREVDAVIDQLPSLDRTISTHAAGAGTVIGPDLRTNRPATTAEESRAAVTSTLHTAATLIGPDLRARPAPASRARWGGWIGALVLLAALVGGGVWWLNHERPLPKFADRGARQRIGHVVPLFNGINTGGWEIGNGNWVSLAGDAVLQGTNGVIGRPLPRRRVLGLADDLGDHPPLWYRLEVLLAAPGETEPQPTSELHFGLSEALAGEPCRYVLRREGMELVVGSRIGERGEFVRDRRIAARAIGVDEDAAVEAERLPTGWFIDVNGEPFATMPLESRPRPEFALLAEGTARFADLFLQAEEPSEPRP
jgi:serine/threonine protein kinase